MKQHLNRSTSRYTIRLSRASQQASLNQACRCLLWRSLASDLGINLHTVNKAYAILRDEGYVQMRGRAGAVISEPSDAGRAEKNRETLSAIEDDLFKLALTYRACGGARGEFVESAAAQAARAYATISDVPESASTKRSMKKHPARSSAKKGAVEGPSAQGA